MIIFVKIVQRVFWVVLFTTLVMTSYLVSNSFYLKKVPSYKTLSSQALSDTFNDSTGLFHSLQKVVFSYDTPINTFPSQVILPSGKSNDLFSIEIIGSNISSIPDEVRNLGSFPLKKLVVSQSGLVIISGEISKLLKLEYLDFSGNNIQNIPDEIGDLTSLETLILSGNDLSSLPENMRKLRNLRVLDLRNNDLSSIPDLSRLIKLEFLFLGGNDFSTEDMERMKIIFSETAVYF